MTKLAPLPVEKPWGSTRLPAPFETVGGKRIGEIWFPAPPDTEMPVLAKYLFTSEALSIQVHPSDAEARARGLPLGKEECWFILDAEPGAQLGIGTTRKLSPKELYDAALTGEIESLMQWHPAEPGMLFHIPPGTVHAIGAGISLVEIQQSSDVTYRLYDYGRPRELHLSDGIAVAKAKPFPASGYTRINPRKSSVLLKTSHFDLFQIVDGDLSPLQEQSGLSVVIPLEGSASVGGLRVVAGECLLTKNVVLLSTSEDSRILVAQSK